MSPFCLLSRPDKLRGIKGQPGCAENYVFGYAVEIVLSQNKLYA